MPQVPRAVGLDKDKMNGWQGPAESKKITDHLIGWGGSDDWLRPGEMPPEKLLSDRVVPEISRQFEITTYAGFCGYADRWMAGDDRQMAWIKRKWIIPGSGFGVGENESQGEFWSQVVASARGHTFLLV
jgi:hypothetical protein